jgi:hypothetical protein
VSLALNSRAAVSFLKRWATRPAVVSAHVFVFWLVPCQSPGFIPESLIYAQLAGALIAAIATALEMRRRRTSEEAALRRRARFLLRLLTAGAVLFVLICFFFVVYYDKKGPTTIIPIGFRGLDCCGGQDPEDCIHDKLNGSSEAIAACWGVFPVTSVRLGLVASYWLVAGASGALIGLLLRLLWGRPAIVQRPVSTEWAYDLFLSYSSQDHDFVAGLVKDLQNQGFTIWWDEPGVGAGDSIGASVEEGLRKSRRFAVVLSPSSVSSDWVLDEVGAARALASNRRKQGVTSYLIPILYQKCEVPELLMGKRYADFTRSRQQGLDELLRQLLPSSEPP